MRIAVTGATGFIGWHVLQVLLADGDNEIIAAGRTVPPPHPRLTFVETDLLMGEDCEWLATYRPTHLLHLAWYAEHGRFWDSPLNRDWCEATARLTRAFCEQGGERMVAAGSCAEYDWCEEDWCQESETPLRPSTSYGMEKNRSREQVQEICATNGVSFAWGRVFYPFGPGEARARLIPSVVDALLQWRAPFAIQIKHQRDLMPVEDVARAFKHLLHCDRPGIFNICSGTPTRMGDLIKRISEALDCDPQSLLDQGREDGEGPRFLVGNNCALQDTGWYPQYDPMERLRNYVCALAQRKSDNNSNVKENS